MAIRMLQRDYKPVSLIKGWNTHLARSNNDRITNHTSLRQSFRSMIKWALYFVKSDHDQSHLNEKGFNKNGKTNRPLSKMEAQNGLKQQKSDIAQYNQKTDPIPTITNFLCFLNDDN